MTGGGDETGPRKRSLGKARRVLKTSEATSPREDEDAAKEKNRTSSIVSENRNASKSDENIHRPQCLRTINESDDGLLQNSKPEDLIISDLRLTDDLQLDVPDLNTSFDEDSGQGDVAMNDENRFNGLPPPRDVIQPPGRVGKRSPLQEMNCQEDNHHHPNHDGHSEMRQYHGSSNSGPSFPQTPMQKIIPSHSTASKSALQQQQQQQWNERE